MGDLVIGVVPDEDHKAFSCSVCHRVQGQECSQGSITSNNPLFEINTIRGCPLCVYHLST